MKQHKSYCYRDKSGHTVVIEHSKHNPYTWRIYIDGWFLWESYTVRNGKRLIDSHFKYVDRLNR